VVVLPFLLSRHEAMRGWGGINKGKRAKGEKEGRQKNGDKKEKKRLHKDLVSLPPSLILLSPPSRVGVARRRRRRYHRPNMHERYKEREPQPFRLCNSAADLIT